MNPDKAIQRQMILAVERAVRPLHASMARKRQMREELLAHLTGIYEQEQQRHSGGPQRHADGPQGHTGVEAVLAAALTRFGDPAALSRELAASLPVEENRKYAIERFLGWRAPESGGRYLLRLASRLLLVLGALTAVILGGLLWHIGPDASLWIALRPAIALCLLMPAAQLVLGLLYFRLRDAMWGAFGQARSAKRAALWSALIAPVVLAAGLGFIAMAEGSLASAVRLGMPIVVAAVVAPVGYWWMARTRGPIEIADTTWECLDLGERTGGNASPTLASE